MAEAAVDEKLTPNDAARITEELLDAQNHAFFLGLTLNVKRCDVEAIHKKMYSNPKEQLFHVTSTALEQNDRTWRDFVDALRSPLVGLTSLARKVEIAHFPDPASSREVVSWTAAHTPSSEEVTEQIKRLKRSFATLKNNIKECLKKRKIIVEKVADVLTSISADEDEQHMIFLENHVTVLFRAADLPELFGTMNFHWNYLNPALLDHLVQSFDLEEIKGEMETYMSDLELFRKKTLLVMFCCTQKRRRLRLAPEFSELVAEFDWPHFVTLEVVEQFRQEYASKYNLRECAMMVAQIRPGSFIVTWIIPASIVKVLKAKAARDIFKKFSVIRVDIDGVCVYRKRIETVILTSHDPAVKAKGVVSGSSLKREVVSSSACLLEDEYAFVEQPSEDFFCPVTKGLLLQPHLTSCCGNHISEEAAARIQGEEGGCPLCKKQIWGTMFSKHFQRQVNLLHVFCRHEDKGCGWRGELASFHSHIKICPMSGGPLMTELVKLPVYTDGETSSTADRTTKDNKTPIQDRMIHSSHLETMPQSPVQAHQPRKLIVRCNQRGTAPCSTTIRRGSATTNNQCAYFTSLYFDSLYQIRYDKYHIKCDELQPCPFINSGLAILRGELTAVGGWNEFFPETNRLVTFRHNRSWVAEYPPMKSARSSPAVVTTADNNYLIVMGGNAGGEWMSTVDVLEINKRRWYKANGLPESLPYPSATICGNRLNVMGSDSIGYSCSLHPLQSTDEPITSPFNLFWKPLPPPPLTRSTVATLRQQLIIVGGMCNQSPVNNIYQLVDEQWVEISTMSCSRERCLAVNVSDSVVIVVGGERLRRGLGKQSSQIEECIICD